MHKRTFLAATTFCFALIVYATLTKIAGRPTLMGLYEPYWIVILERFSAYGVLGCLFALLLPGRLALSITLVISVAIVLEALQALIPTRDPSIVDIMQKSAGGIAGCLLAQMIILIFSPRPPSP